MKTDIHATGLQPEEITNGEFRDPAVAIFDEALRAHLRSLVSSQLIREHQANPFGPHGPVLTSLLAYFRTSPVAGKLAILSMEDMGPYRLVALSGKRGVAPSWASEDIYRTLGEAEHAVFLARLDLLVGER